MSDKLKKVAEDNQTSAGMRFAAGEDPAKREQILEGAKRVFLRMGFDAASMNDVTREAGVSKGTIYVYFSNKEDLFAALMMQQKGLFTDRLRDALADSKTVEEGLSRYGHAFAYNIVATDMVIAMRTVLGVVDRMPSLCKGFLTTAPNNARTVLAAFLEQHVANGSLEIDDIEIAARQFIDLATGTYFKMRMFNELHEMPPQKEIDQVIDSAVKVFMKAYGKQPN